MKVVTFSLPLAVLTYSKMTIVPNSTSLQNVECMVNFFVVLFVVLKKIYVSVSRDKKGGNVSYFVNIEPLIHMFSCKTRN